MTTKNLNTNRGSQIIFNQLFAIFDVLDNEKFAELIPLLNGATIGKHTRHILDFYKCIVNGGERTELDYGLRDRSPSVESNIDFAKSTFLELQSEIDKLNPDQALLILTDFHLPESTKRPAVHSSIGRELMYAYDHAVHHLAIIMIAIQNNFPEIDLSENIGVSNSTIKYKSSTQNK